MKTLKIMLAAATIAYALLFMWVGHTMRALCPDNYRIHVLGGYCEPTFEDICLESGGRLIETGGQQACAGVK